MLLNQLKTAGITCTPEKALLVVKAMRDRITFPQELLDHARFFFEDPATYDAQVVAKKFNAQAGTVLLAYAGALSDIRELNATVAQAAFEMVCTAAGIKTGQVLQLLRVCITGLAGGPDLMLTIEIIGGDVAANRINTALTAFNSTTAA